MQNKLVQGRQGFRMGEKIVYHGEWSSQWFVCSR